MAERIQIGPYSAYALAVKYGYQGSEEEWVKEQEANRTAAEAAAVQAKTSETAAKESADRASSSADLAEEAVKTEGDAQLEAVRKAGQDSLGEIASAKEEAVEEVKAAGAAFPAPTEGESGKVPAVTPDGSGYQLAGPFAPLPAAIRPTVCGNPAICENGVAWPLQGLSVYGRSTQYGTPSPETPLPIVSAGEGGSITLSVSDGADQSQTIVFSTPFGLPGVPVESGGNYTDMGGQQWICDEVDFARGMYVQNVASIVWTADGIAQMEFTVGEQSGGWTTDGDTLPFFVYYSSSGMKEPRTSGLMGKCSILEGTTNLVGLDKPGASCERTDFFILRVLKSALMAYGLPGSDWTSENSSEAIRGFLQALAPIQIMYPVAAAETPIDAETMAEFRALTVYDGVTVVSTAEPVAGLEAKYVADGQKYLESLESRLAALETAQTGL